MDLHAYLARISQARQDLALRQRPSPFAFALADGIDLVRADDWDAIVAPGHVWLSRAYLRALERARPPGMHFRYAIAYQGRRPAVAMAWSVFDVDLDAVGSRNDEPTSLRERVLGVAKAVGEALGKSPGARLLVAGNAWNSGEHALAIASGIDPAAAVHALADATYRIRRAEKLHGPIASVLVKDFYPERAGAAAELERFGYHRFEVDPNMVLELDPKWRDAAAYLGAMSAKYRRRAKDARKQGKSLVTRRLSTDEVATRRDDLYARYLAVHERAFFRIADPGADYVPEVTAALGEDAVVRGVFLDDALVGFSFGIHGGEDYDAHMVGMDYAHNTEHGIYQNMLYDFVEEAIARGRRRVVMGRTALEMKSALGAAARPMACWMRHGNPVGNRLIAPLVARLEPNEWTPRNPWKDAPEP